MDLGILIILMLLYFLPAILAEARGCKASNAICVLNLFLGWTILGWVAAMVWAFAAVTKKEQMQELTPRDIRIINEIVRRNREKEQVHS